MSIEAKVAKQDDENTAMFKQREKNYAMQSPETRSKLDDLARLKGYDGFMGMARLFWEQKIYPYFAKALYGPQQGLEDLLVRMRNWVKSVVGHHEAVEPSIDQNDYVGLSMVNDLVDIFQGANLTPEEARAALSDFCGVHKAGHIMDESHQLNSN